jgi:LysR family transcriptional regulator, low CO2-responsive transcriptional regulator
MIDGCSHTGKTIEQSVIVTMNCFHDYDSIGQWCVMDVRDLEVFLAVLKHLNFTRAGEEIHLSQPSVSVRIRRLEEELQVKLFDQIGKRVVLLEAGRLLEPYARHAVTARNSAHQAIKEFQGLEQGSLRIGASTTPGMYLVPRIIAGFHQQHPRISIILSIKNTGQVEEGIIRDEFDLGFVGGHLISDEIQTLSWRRDEIVAVVPPSHNLTKKKRIKLSELAKEQFLCREPGSATRAVVEKVLREMNYPTEQAIELGNPEAVKQAVICGLGYAFLSKFAIEMELKSKRLVAVTVQGLRINRELKMIYRKGKHLSPAAITLIETAQLTQ